jgi:hypothetical protein
MVTIFHTIIEFCIANLNEFWDVKNRVKLENKIIILFLEDVDSVVALFGCSKNNNASRNYVTISQT